MEVYFIQSDPFFTTHLLKFNTVSAKELYVMLLMFVTSSVADSATFSPNRNGCTEDEDQELSLVNRIL